MMRVAVLRIGKLTEGERHVWRAARHNLREIQQELGVEDGSINPGRTALNSVMYGPTTARGVADLAQMLMDEARVKPLRKDAVRALEIIFSLPRDVSVDHDGFFADCVDWTIRCFPVPLLSVVRHQDEDCPHIHVLLLPLLEGRMNGSTLMGNRKRLQALQDDFHDKVGSRYGLTKQRSVARLTASARKRVARLAIAAIKADPSLIENPEVSGALQEAIQQNPAGIMTALNIPGVRTMPRDGETFTKIMTKPCKQRKHIGFELSEVTGTDRTLSCVGFPVNQSSDAADDIALKDAGPGSIWRAVAGASSRGYWCRRCTPSALRGVQWGRGHVDQSDDRRGVKETPMIPARAGG